MRAGLRPGDRIGLIRPSIDAHDLGPRALSELLAASGVASVFAPEELRAALRPAGPGGAAPMAVGPLLSWIRAEGLDALGFSYRLDPGEGAAVFIGLARALREGGAMADSGGRLRALYFAGLPEACRLVREGCPGVAAVFGGDEDDETTLEALGLDPQAAARADEGERRYDRARLDFGRELVAKGDYLGERAVDRSGSLRFGLRGERVESRIAHGRVARLPPLLRAHFGPYLPDREAALALFRSSVGKLVRSGFLDVLSIGNSQLSQSDFGGDWEGKPDGGGAPFNAPRELEEAWAAARPMLVRCYAGTKDVAGMARTLEATIDNAWHALSLWWFCETDGRGPNGLLENLGQHVEALRFIAASGKPYEPNVAHHFAFRGGDDLTCVVATYLACRTARRAGVGSVILQTMLNTPRRRWGVQDLAMARATLRLVRGIRGLQVYLQPRGGLDYFSSDEATAKAQLAACTALMDDIEPNDRDSPSIVHVVSHSEGRGLADPATIDESLKLTLRALSSYREAKARGLFPGMAADADVDGRTRSLLANARAIIAAIEASMPDPYSARGLYEAFASGFLRAPGLSSCREELAEAVSGSSALVSGGVVALEADGSPLTLDDRLRRARDARHRRALAAGEAR